MSFVKRILTCRLLPYGVQDSQIGSKGMTSLVAKILLNNIHVQNDFELLQKAKELFPGSVRVMLTGFSDVTTILHAMNSGEVYRFITKPWKLEAEAINIINESINYSKYLSSRFS